MRLLLRDPLNTKRGVEHRPAVYERFGSKRMRDEVLAGSKEVKKAFNWIWNEDNGYNLHELTVRNQHDIS